MLKAMLCLWFVKPPSSTGVTSRTPARASSRWLASCPPHAVSYVRGSSSPALLTLLDVPLSPPVCMEVAMASVLAPSGLAGSVAVGDARGKYGEGGIPRPVGALLR